MADILVQRVTGTMSAAQTTIDVTIPTTLGSTTSAFLWPPFSLPSAGVGRQASGASNDPQYWGVDAELISTTTVRFTRFAATTNESCEVAVDVVEYTGAAGGSNEFIVRHRERVQYGSTATSATSSAIAGISDLTKCVAFGTFSANAASLTVPQVFGDINIENDGTNDVLVARRSTGGAGRPFASMECVEFTGGNWSIQQVPLITPVLDNGDENTTVSEVPSLTKTWIHRFVRPHSAGNGVDDITGYARLSTTTNLVTRNKDVGSLTRVRVFLISNDDMTVENFGAPDGTDDWTAGASPQTENLTVTAIDTDRTIPVIQAGSSGTASTDHPAAQWRATLSSTTNMAVLRGKSTGGSEYFAQTVQFPEGTTATTPVVIESITADPLTLGATATVVGSGFKAVQGIGNATIGGVAVTEASWTDTSFTFTVPTTMKYGIHDVVVTNSDGEQDTFQVTIDPGASYAYVDVVTPWATTGQRITASADIAQGDQIRWTSVTGTAMTLADVTVLSDGSFECSSAVTGFTAEVNDGTGWQAAAGAQTISGGTAPTFPGPNIGNLNYVVNSAITPVGLTGGFSGATSYTLQGGAVAGLALSGAGTLSGTPTAVGSYAGRYVRGANADGVYDSNTFTITISAAGSAPTTVSAPPNLVYAYPNANASLLFDTSDYFAGATSFSISGTLESGWTFDTTTGLLNMTPKPVGTYGPFTVTAYNANGNVSQAAFTVRFIKPSERNFAMRMASRIFRL